MKFHPFAVFYLVSGSASGIWAVIDVLPTCADLLQPEGVTSAGFRRHSAVARYPDIVSDRCLTFHIQHRGGLTSFDEGTTLLSADLAASRRRDKQIWGFPTNRASLLLV